MSLNSLRVARSREKKKRVELLLDPLEYVEIADAAKHAGMSVSAYIKTAVRGKMEMEVDYEQKV